MTVQKKLIAGNWKMNMLHMDAAALAREVVAGADKAPCDLLLCPPSTLISWVAETASGSVVAVGGQDCHEADSGAYTGDVSATMVRDAGASHVILGHSERRHGLGETDERVRAKTEAAHGAGLVAIVCIGETEEQRDAGETLNVLSSQLDGSLPTGDNGFAVNGKDTVIAYEPVWAIGTGRTPTVDEVQAAHGHIRAHLTASLGEQAEDIRILYGGSMKPENAADLLAIENVDGGLIGGASLSADSFLAIADAAPA
ncbi:MAG: triose-phosphate isomerase [Alphaproteobacteria bacterium]|nr:triose-phosphate isomerase [Alphaproteobacteria bacterium]